jgi:excisionase family DNA binding protein
MSDKDTQAVYAKLERIETLTLMAAKDVLTLSEAAAYTGYSEKYMYQLAFSRQIPYSKRGKYLYFDKAELKQWLLAGRVATKDEIESAAATYVAQNRKQS